MANEYGGLYERLEKIGRAAQKLLGFTSNYAVVVGVEPGEETQKRCYVGLGSDFVEHGRTIGEAVLKIERRLVTVASVKLAEVEELIAIRDSLRGPEFDP